MRRIVLLKHSGRISLGRSRKLPCLGLAMALAFAWLGIQPVASLAQTSRAQVIEDEQKAKAADLETEHPSALERAMEWVKRSPLLVGTGGVYPWFGSVYPGTGLGIGAGYLKRLPYGSLINLHAAVSVRGSSTVDVQAQLPEVKSGLFTVALDASRTDAKRLLFYGLGPDSTRDNATHYEIRFTGAGATANLRPAVWFQLAGGYKWLSVDGVGHLPTPSAKMPSLGQGLRYQVAQAGVKGDWRPSPGYSTRGGFYRLTWTHYRETQNRPFSFQSVEGEAAQLVPLLREQFVLAVRGLATITMTSKGNEVPFELSPTLGSDDTLRGFATRRFTDRNRLLLTAEYRWRPSRYLDMALFVDAGKVAPHRSGLNLSNLETDWGIGARFHGHGFTGLRLEVAKCREGWRVVLVEHQVF